MSREIGSRPLEVIFTARRAVFICGETEAMVPCTIVPMNSSASSICERVEGGLYHSSVLL